MWGMSVCVCVCGTLGTVRHRQNCHQVDLVVAWFSDWQGAADSHTLAAHLVHQCLFNNPGLHCACRQIISSTRRGTWSASYTRTP